VKYANTFVVQYKVYKSIVKKSIDGRTRTREAVQRNAARQTKKCYRGQAFIASDFSSKDLNQDILRFKEQKQA
jgi:hypothetical protein